MLDGDFIFAVGRERRPMFGDRVIEFEFAEFNQFVNAGGGGDRFCQARHIKDGIGLEYRPGRRHAANRLAVFDLPLADDKRDNAGAIVVSNRGFGEFRQRGIVGRASDWCEAERERRGEA